MKRFLLFALAASLSLLGPATGCAALLVDPAGGTPLLEDSTDDDDVAGDRALGFEMTFFGETHTTVDVAVNGNLNFSRDSEFTNRPMPSLADVARISALWDDLAVLPALGDSIVEKVSAGAYYSVTWTVHSRLNPLSRHVFQVVIFGRATRLGKLSFRANDIALAYQELGVTFDKGTATVGLDAGDESTFATVPDLEAAGGEVRSKFGPELLKISGGQILFRLTEEGAYVLPLLSNRAPVPVADAGYGGGVITIPVLANDRDADGDIPLLDAVSQGAAGKVIANPDGSVTYTAGPHFAGTDEFTYTVIDGSGASATGTVRIMPFAVAKGAYDGPLFPPVEDPEAEIDPDLEESAHLRIFVKDSGLFDAELRFPDETFLKFHGQFGANGRYEQLVSSPPEDEFQLSYQVSLVLNFLGGVNRISGTIDDGSGPLLLIAPRSINSPPEARDDLFYLSRGRLIMNVLANDSDRDGDALTILSFSQGQSGVVTRSADGRSLSYLSLKAGGGTDRLTYTVADSMGLMATAHVTVLTWVSAGGSYDGLVTSVDPDVGTLVAANSGRLRIAVQPSGVFTASLAYGGAPFILRGAFDTAGHYTGHLNLPDEVVLTVQLNLDLTRDAGQITGTLTDGDGLVVSRVAVGRARFRARYLPAAQAGAYAVLPVVDDTGLVPAVAWARLAVSPTGAVTMVGRFGSGALLFVTAQLQMDGTIPIYLSRRVVGTKHTGYLLGTLAFADPLGRSNLSGHLTLWVPPSDDGESVESQEEVDLTGTFHQAPGAKEGLLVLPASSPNAEVVIEGTPVPVTIDASGRVLVDKSDPNQLTLILQPKTGLFTGTFKELDPDAPTEVFRTRTFSGIILRTQNRGGGVFTRGTTSGPIILQPILPPE